MSAIRRPEVFISATSADLRTCRQLVKEALLTLGCTPVEQANFPPSATTVREMLRQKLLACDAVIHLAGLCYGAEPSERSPDQPRRSYTQLEYDLARELGRPVYVFVCGVDFPYDDCTPEDEERRSLQLAHRTRLQADDHLFTPVGSRDELALRVHALQTKVEHLAKELNQSRFWLARGVAIGLAFVVLLGGGLWWLRHQTARERLLLQRENEARQRENTELRKDMADYHARLITQTQLTDRILAEVSRQTALASTADHNPPVLAAQVAVAAQTGISLPELKRQLAAEGADVKGILTAIDQNRFQIVETELELAKLRHAALIKLGDTELAAAHYAEAITAFKAAEQTRSRESDPAAWVAVQVRLGRAYTEWSNVSEGLDIGERSQRAIARLNAALDIYTPEANPSEWAETQFALGRALHSRAVAAQVQERARLLSAAIAAYRQATKIQHRDKSHDAWAGVQLHLANALLDQAKGAVGSMRAGLLQEVGITCRSALEIATPERLPILWPLLRNTWAMAMQEEAKSLPGNEYPEGVWVLLKGQEKPDIPLTASDQRLLEAIRLCQEVLDRPNFTLPPLTRALLLTTRASLDFDLSNRQEFSDRQFLLVSTTNSYLDVLQIISRKDSPQVWARTQLDLSAALIKRARLSNEPEKFLLAAKQANDSALEVFTRDAAPQTWARIQLNTVRLANDKAIDLLDQDDQIERSRIQLEKNYRSLFQVYTREDLPWDWAGAQLERAKDLWSLADRASDQQRRELMADIENQLRAVLTVYSAESASHEAAWATYTLANVLLFQMNGATGTRRTQLLQELGSYLTAALRHFPPESHTKEKNTELFFWLKVIEAELSPANSTTAATEPHLPVLPEVKNDRMFTRCDFLLGKGNDSIVIVVPVNLPEEELSIYVDWSKLWFTTKDRILAELRYRDCLAIGRRILAQDRKIGLVEYVKGQPLPEVITKVANVYRGRPPFLPPVSKP